MPNYSNAMKPVADLLQKLRSFDASSDYSDNTKMLIHTTIEAARVALGNPLNAAYLDSIKMAMFEHITSKGDEPTPNFYLDIANSDLIKAKWLTSPFPIPGAK